MAKMGRMINMAVMPVYCFMKKMKILNVSNTVSHVIKNHEALGTQCNH